MNFDSELIECVRHYEGLYNPLHPDYRNTPVRKEIWEKISKELNTDHKKCQKRWNNLRKFHRRIRMQMNESGTLPNMKKRWQFEQMEFIEKYRRKRRKYEPAQSTHLPMSDFDYVTQDTSGPFSTDNPFATVENPYLSEEDSQDFEVVEESSLECELLPANHFNSDKLNMKQKKYSSARFGISSQSSISDSENPTKKKLVKRRRLSTSFPLQPSTSLPNSCSHYLSIVGAKIDDILLPTAVRYDLEKKVADLVYDVLVKYSSEDR